MTYSSDISHYTILSDVYGYPLEGFTKQLGEALQVFENRNQDAADLFRPFAEFMSSLSLKDQQELFVRSFEVQSVTTIDLGYVLFGDDYKRGELLVQLSREHRAVNNDCGIELADHLANVLRLMPLMEDKALVHELAQKIVWVALGRIIDAFSPKQMALKDDFYKRKLTTLIDRPTENYLIYVKAIEALFVLMERDFGLTHEPEPEKQSDFLKNLHTEIALEG
ncbi:MAG: hypothetical protein HYZ16_02545 [Bacteroidetes bacterium]|nr:hypothetical protein [Bacteroidota bacterium]